MRTLFGGCWDNRGKESRLQIVGVLGSLPCLMVLQSAAVTNLELAMPMYKKQLDLLTCNTGLSHSALQTLCCSTFESIVTGLNFNSLYVKGPLLKGLN